MSLPTVKLGPQDGSGYNLTLLRGFEDGTEEYSTKALRYELSGVEDVEITDPWNIGGGKLCQVDVTFTTGESEYINALVTGISLNE